MEQVNVCFREYKYFSRNVFSRNVYTEQAGDFFSPKLEKHKHADRPMC